jgi:hypothetical protein
MTGGETKEEDPTHDQCGNVYGQHVTRRPASRAGNDPGWLWQLGAVGRGEMV